MNTRAGRGAAPAGDAAGAASPMTGPRFWVQRASLPRCDPRELRKHSSFSSVHACSPLPSAPRLGQPCLHPSCLPAPAAGRPLQQRQRLAACIDIVKICDQSTVFPLSLLAGSFMWVCKSVCVSCRQLAAWMSWFCWCQGCGMLLHPDPPPCRGDRSCHTASAADRSLEPQCNRCPFGSAQLIQRGLAR